MKKFARCLTGLLIALSISFTLPGVVAAQSNATTVGTIELVPTFTSISVYSSFTGDDNKNNQAVIEYRPSGGTWKAAPIPMVVDRRVEIPVPNTGWGERPNIEYMTNPYYKQWRGNILFVQPNTEYEVRVTYSDPDGVSGPTSHNAVVRMWDEDPPSTGNSLHVSPTGSDSNPGTLAAPLKTPSRAAALAQPGTTVYLHGGTYTGTYNISSTGLANNYIKWVPYGDGDVIFTGWLGLSISGSYNRFIGQIHVPGASKIRLVSSSYLVQLTGDFNRVEDCIDEGAGFMFGPGEGSGGFVLGRGNVVSGCEGNGGMSLLYSGGNMVIRRNILRAGTSGGAGDGIYGAPNFPGFFTGDAIDWGAARKDSDLYENEIWDTGDDIVEMDGAGINVRIWSNRLHFCRRGRGGVGISLGPGGVIGPIYVFRNLIYDFNGTATKLGKDSSGQTFFYQNTFYYKTYWWESSGAYDPDGCGFTNWAGGAFYNHHFRNNILVSRQHVENMAQYEHPDLIARMGFQEPINDWDYNLYWEESTGAPGGDHGWWNRYWIAGESNYRTFTTFNSWRTASGQEAHGLFDNPKFVNPSPTIADFRLQDTSPAIDKGIILPGFNDANSPWPYTGAAPDMGALEYGSGPPTNQPPVLNTIGNKSVTAGQLLQFTISATDPNGDNLIYSASNLPQGASFNTSTKSFSWTPTSGQVGTYSNVHFEVSDGSLTDYENITITVVSGGNQPPVLAPIGNKTTVAGSQLQFTISATDPDGNPLTYSASNLPSGASFNAGTRTFSWTPTTGQVGTYSNVHFEVSDGSLTDYEDITITVTASPSLPLRVEAGGGVYTDSSSNIWQADRAYTSGSWGFYGPNYTDDRGTGYAINGTEDDRIYQTQRYSLSGYRVDLGNGTYTVILHFAETYSGITGSGQRVFDVLIEGQLALDNLDIYAEAGHSTALVKRFNSIVVQDGQLNIDFTPYIENPEINGIEITSAGGTNQPPVLAAIGNKSVTAGQLLQFTISATDPNGDNLAYSASNLPLGASFNTATRTFAWTPTSGQVGTYPNVHFEVSDGSLTDYENITITVNAVPPPNSPPVLDPIGNKSVTAGQSLQFTISATDPNGDNLAYSASNLPLGASFNAAIRTFSWTPTSGQVGTYSNVHFEVSDGSLTDYENITITVTSTTTNEPPVLNSIGNKSVVAGQLLQFTISATDPNGDNLTYSASNLPQGASFNAAIRTFSWTPTTAEVGTYSNVHFEVSDGSLTDYENITITVNAPTPPAGGGGGGGGLPPSDGTPPVISSIIVSDITKTSAIIRWTTNEESTSQVKYWASPESLSPLDETAVTSHVVELTGLAPYTTYHLTVISRDQANNLAESEEYTFTTLGQPATFTVNGLKISLAKARINEAVVVRVTVNNIGDVGGSYDVTLNVSSSRGSEIMKQTVQLAAGASQEVSFVVAKQTTGVFQASVNDLTGSFSVVEEPSVATTPEPQPEISLFSAIPSYSAALHITAVSITYELVNASEDSTDTKLVLKVSLNGQPLEDVIVFSGSVLPVGATSGNWEYVPSSGWVSGTYTFRAELYSGVILSDSAPEEVLDIKTESPAVVNWYVLALIIGAMLVAISGTIMIILRRRRDLVKRWAEDSGPPSGIVRRN